MNVPSPPPNRPHHRNEWLPARRKHREPCCDRNASDRPPEHVTDGDLWRCPICHRRWKVTVPAPANLDDDIVFLPHYSEGVTIGKARAAYWRPYRARFIGYPFGS